MMKKGKIIETLILPEEVIHHIQSFMNGKEAARSSTLSKSWHAAWLTRPDIDLHDGDFGYSQPDLQQFWNKTIQRYQDLNLKIQSFRLRCRGYDRSRNRLDINPNRIVSAIQMGATDVKLEFPLELFPFPLPRPVLASETLIRLSLTGCRLDGFYEVGCSSLKSLNLKDVTITSHLILKNIISSCGSIEELSLSTTSDERSMWLGKVNLYQLHKLGRLFLDNVLLDTKFFSDFASRFPCLKDLTLHRCIDYYTKVKIASTSLQTISFIPVGSKQEAEFQVPNIRKFFYLSSCLPSKLSIKGATREWELDISIITNTFGKTTWFDNLKRHLAKFRLSKISLCVECKKGEWECEHDARRPKGKKREHDVRRDEHEKIFDVEVVPKPIGVEKLKVDAPPTLRGSLLLRLLGVCRPKFVSLVWLSGECMACSDIVHKRLAAERDMFGLKRVSMEVYKEIEDEICSLASIITS